MGQILTKIKLIIKKFLNVIKPKIIIPENKFSVKNYGIIERLEKALPSNLNKDKVEFINNIINIFGIQVEFPLELRKFIKGISRKI